MYIDNLDEIQNLLERETPILTAEIRALYRELDKQFHLRGARIPITFGYEKDLLGSYTPASEQEKEHFHFSLLFVGYALKNPLSRSDRIDLYKHEYAHYMQYNMEIPRQYRWQAGKHGSAWKYCCSLIGAAPTPCYKAGEGLMKHDYEKALKNPRKGIAKNAEVRNALDNYRREKAYQEQKKTTISYKIGDSVSHPKFGAGIIEAIEKGNGSVWLVIRFQEEVRKIDQQWLLRSNYKKSGN